MSVVSAKSVITRSTASLWRALNSCWWSAVVACFQVWNPLITNAFCAPFARIFTSLNGFVRIWKRPRANDTVIRPDQINLPCNPDLTGRSNNKIKSDLWPLTASANKPAVECIPDEYRSKDIYFVNRVNESFVRRNSNFTKGLRRKEIVRVSVRETFLPRPFIIIKPYHQNCYIRTCAYMIYHLQIRLGSTLVCRSLSFFVKKGGYSPPWSALVTDRLSIESQLHSRQQLPEIAFPWNFHYFSRDYIWQTTFYNHREPDKTTGRHIISQLSLTTCSQGYDIILLNYHVSAAYPPTQYIFFPDLGNLYPPDLWNRRFIWSGLSYLYSYVHLSNQASGEFFYHNLIFHILSWESWMLPEGVILERLASSSYWSSLILNFNVSRTRFVLL